MKKIKEKAREKKEITFCGTCKKKVGHKKCCFEYTVLNIQQVIEKDRLMFINILCHYENLRTTKDKSRKRVLFNVCDF